MTTPTFTPDHPVIINKKESKRLSEIIQTEEHGDPAIAHDASKQRRPKKKKKEIKIRERRTFNNIRVHFLLRYHTSFGQSLYITGEHSLFGNSDLKEALPMQYLDDKFWQATIEIGAEDLQKDLRYNYVLKQEDGTVTVDWGNDKMLTPSLIHYKEVQVIDTWNHAGFIENVFYTEPFQQVLLSDHAISHKKANSAKKFTHIFKAKAPLLQKNEVLCLLGNCKQLKEWNENAPLLMDKPDDQDHWQINVDMTNAGFPIAYKYGVYHVKEKRFIRFEEGNDRILYDAIGKDRLSIINDGFVQLPATTWKGAGIAIPVFSLRSSKGAGVGEFNDIKALVDWARETGLKLIQILPVNDTIATHTWTDSYPYAAISAFALNPVYLHVDKLIDKKDKELSARIKAEKAKLNALSTVDHEAVLKFKWEILDKAYAFQKEKIFNTKAYAEFFTKNEHWLVPYAAFCYLRDLYGTADFSQWKTHNAYDPEAVRTLTSANSDVHDKIRFHYFVQFHLHVQLKEATEYAHAHGVIVKGDIPIGIYRHSVDAWQSPELYNMDLQAGAPPDDFAVKGQNWGFPTYNWQRMQEDDYEWWKKRFEQMSHYFDAFRIDHILGFFRIWSIPMHAVEGIMGHFVPATPVHINEFNQQNIYFDHDRYCRPFITDDIIWQIFGDDQEKVKEAYLDYDGFGNYRLKAAFDTQRKVEAHFVKDNKNEKIRDGLYDLISNVILLPDEHSQGQAFHFRFGVESTTSFQALDHRTQQMLKDLYVNYFFQRQDDRWMKEAMKKLPALKRATNMLVCGEDLGLVPACVPDVMKDLGLLSLEIQRMPKDPQRIFFHPTDAPYLSVVTPSTHDMSTIRGWWEEDRTRTQRFFNHEIGQWGDASFFCEPWIVKAILLQHMYSPAMWSIFQLQDLLGMDGELRRDDPHEERINDPSNPKHYWRYRMHITLEGLLYAEEFNNELHTMIRSSGR